MVKVSQFWRRLPETGEVRRYWGGGRGDGEAQVFKFCYHVLTVGNIFWTKFKDMDQLAR